jgi:hypothetical protein
MAYSFTNSKGTTYYLHNQEVHDFHRQGAHPLLLLQGFEEGDALDAVPAGYTVAEMKTGLPVLKKSEAPAEAQRNQSITLFDN